VKILIAVNSPFASWCIPGEYVERIREALPGHTIAHAPTDAETLAAIPDADVVFSARLRPEQIAAATRLRWVHSPAAGVGNMLFPALKNSPVVVTSSRGNSATTIAEHVVMVTLALLRNLRLALRRQAERRWAQDEFDAGAVIATLKGARVLIVGLGSIGAETARLIATFGTHVVGIRRRPEAGKPEGVAEVHGPDALARELPLADVVVLAAPATPETHHLLGASELAAMKDQAMLVNVSRGNLIDEAALVRELTGGRLRAALDVFEHEPLDPASPLWTAPNVLITPHVAGFHPDYWPAVTALFVDNVRRFEAGRPLENVVDKRAGY